MNPLNPGYFEAEELRTFGFAQVGENVRIARNCVVIGPENIRIGDNVRIDAFGALLAANGSIDLGSFIHLCTSVMIGGRGGVTMGDFSCCSSGVRIFSASDDFDGQWMASCNVPASCVQPKVEAVSIGQHVAIGANAVVLPGVVIGDGAAMSPLSAATRSLEGWGLYAGQPARKVRDRSRRVVELESLAKAA